MTDDLPLPAGRADIRVHLKQALQYGQECAWRRTVYPQYPYLGSQVHPQADLVQNLLAVWRSLGHAVQS